MSLSAGSRQVGRLVLSNGLDDVRETILRALHLLRKAISRLGVGALVEWLATLPLSVLRFVLSVCKTITALPFGVVNLFRYVLDLKVQRSVLRSQPRSLGSGGHTAVSVLSGLFRFDFDFHLQLGLPFRRKASRFLVATHTTPVHTVVLGGVRTVGDRGLPTENTVRGSGTPSSRRVTAPVGDATGGRLSQADQARQQASGQASLARRSTELTAADERPSRSAGSRSSHPHTPTAVRTPSPYPVYPQGFSPVAPPRPHYHIPAEPARWPPASRAWPSQAPSTARSPRYCCPGRPPASPSGPLSLPPPSSPPDSTCSLPTISTQRATAFSTPSSSPRRSPRANPLLPAIVNSPGLRSSPSKPVTQGGVSFGLQMLLDADAGCS